ncbi:universal stress protein [Chryseobacterium sp. StRB126]|uniref:universal stress protein n=1 Tax=Chryseobacterium sp. StRB126 TaxID=878220 RepID=UPI0004E98DD2|nr:universal stress protein [Chryseobacterium sp. StRB126]BAP32428.1 universal stress protein [Chryseobacterium sp. StRB126]
MKTILVPTDFSKPSKNAAYYALHLGNTLKANIELCHAFTLPAEDPMFGQVSWPLDAYPELMEGNTRELKKLANALEDKGRVLWREDTFSFHPSISYSCKAGDAVYVINNTADNNNTLLIVMGMQGSGTITRFIFGSNSVRMIKNTKYPLLLIPSDHQYKGLKKIAFSTDMNKKDVRTAQSLIEFAKYFNAELLITYISLNANDSIEDQSYEHKKEFFFKNLDGNICYNCIYSENIDDGLDILKEKDIDMLIMGHQHRGFFDRLMNSSHAARQADQLQIPLLIIPENGNLPF